MDDKSTDLRSLVYRRQFLLTRENIPALSHWNLVSLKRGLYLYSHPDLNISLLEKKGITLVILGYIFDPVLYTKSNEEVLNDILSNACSFNEFLNEIKRYAGQYIFIYLDSQAAYAIHDPLAIREIYYCTKINRIICGSQPNLIKKYSQPLLNISQDRTIQEFYKYDLKLSREGRFWVGDETLYDSIKHLLPNHYLNIAELEAYRYWPSQKLETIDFAEGIALSCEFLQGIIRAAANRKELMMAVTAGIDSRTLLSASKEISDKIYFFINKEKHLNENHPDIFIPKQIFKRINVPFHVHNVKDEVEEQFKAIFLENVFMSTEKVLPVVYNIYYKEHTNRMNILGVGEMARYVLGDDPKRIHPYYLARSLKFKKSQYAVVQCKKWLSSAIEPARKCGLNIMTLLFWEQLGGNWGAVGNSESDIAFEEFNPLNSHYLYEILLRIDTKNAIYDGEYVFTAIIKKLWPELLDYPFNPPYKSTDHIKKLLKNVGLLQPIKRLLYKVDHLLYNCYIILRQQPKGLQ